MNIKDILDLGTTGLLAVGVWALWVRLNTVTDRMLDQLEQGRAERLVIARQNGLSTQDLSAQAQEIRAKAKQDRS